MKPQNLRKYALNYSLILFLLAIEIYLDFYYLPYDVRDPNVLDIMNWILGICLFVSITRLLTYSTSDYEQISPIPTFSVVFLLSWLGSDIGIENVSWINTCLFVILLLSFVFTYPVKYYLKKRNRTSDL